LSLDGADDLEEDEAARAVVFGLLAEMERT